MSSLSASDLTTLRAARPGDILHIETAAGTRTVTVKSVEGRYIYTSSGAVRPGRVSGGFINVEFGTFSPTMAQQARTITAVCRAVAFRAAA